MNDQEFERFLANAYPRSAQAKTAEAALSGMPKSALDTAPPARGMIGVPSSQPSASAQ